MKLRPVTENDGPQIVKWRNDPRISKFFFQKTTLTLDGQKEWFKGYLTRSNREIYFVIENDGLDIGTIGVNDIKDGAGEVTRLLVDPEYQGKNCGFQALKQLDEYVKKKGVRKLYAKIYLNNMSSRRTFEKAGYQLIKTEKGICDYEKKLSG